jgi:hypothetical protein
MVLNNITTANPIIGQFSYYKCPIKNVFPEKNTTLKEVFELIVSDEFKVITNNYRDTKDKTIKSNKLDYVTFNGTFSKRDDNNLISLSGYFVLDIDHISNLCEVRERIVSDETLSPKLVFISPSGDGLKVVISIDEGLVKSDGNKRMLQIWNAVNEYFSQNYSDILKPNQKGEFIDASGTDLSRACFLCHDESAYFNDTSNFKIEKDFIETFKTKSIEQIKPVKEIKPKNSTDINGLAKKHLNLEENHHPELLAFTGACSTISLNKTTVKNYLKQGYKISPSSSWFNNIDYKVNEIYKKYNNNSNVNIINDTTICYHLFSFKYFHSIRKYELSSLYLDGIRLFLEDNGFFKRKVGEEIIFIRKIGNILKEVTLDEIRTFLNNYINSLTENISFEFKGNWYEITPTSIREVYFRNNHNILNDSWLKNLQLNEDKLVKDTKDTMFFFFTNCIVKVTKDFVEVKKWEDLEGCVWDLHVIKRDFNYVESSEQKGCKFKDFIFNIVKNEYDRLESILSIIGYLLHFHFNASEGQAVILYDETITDTKTPMGGTGKGLFINAIKQLRQVSKIDGKNFLEENRFKWENITPSTQIVWIDDVKKDFQFSTLHSNLTDGWTIERKFLNPFSIEPELSPKTVICSNSVIKGGGTTNLRRQVIFEFSDYYSRKIKNGNKPIEEEHGGIFFGEDWCQSEWDSFYTFMFSAAKFYLKNGLIQANSINFELNTFRQNTNEDFADWCINEKFETSVNYNTKDKFNDFLQIYYGDKHNFSQRTFSKWLGEFASFKKWEKVLVKSNGQSLFRFNNSSD